MNKYDSTNDTLVHIGQVRGFINEVILELSARAIEHDASKLEEPEKTLFDAYTPMLALLTYGSDEYKRALSELRPALEHHYANNSHHPEHYKEAVCLVPCGWEGDRDEAKPLCPRCGGSVHFSRGGVDGMDLMDLAEMLCDWKAATLRHDDGDIMMSIEINTERFGLSPQLVHILRNTVENMRWN